MKKLFAIFSMLPLAALCAPGDATVAKWDGDAAGAFSIMFDDGWPSAFQAAIPELEKLDLPADFYIIPQKGEFKVFEKRWHEEFKKPLVHIGNHTWTHGGVKDFAHARDVEFGKCTQYILDNVPGKKPRLISYAQPGVGPGKWNINAEETEKILKEQNLVSRSDFRGRGATYHHKTKADMLTLADKAANEGVYECIIFHGVEVDDPKRGYQDFWAMSVKEYVPFFEELAVRRDRGELWIADHIRFTSMRPSVRRRRFQKFHQGGTVMFSKLRVMPTPSFTISRSP